jgi:hypothetical protein
MGVPVTELQRRMSSLEFSEWLAFYSLEPWGWEAEMYGHAQTAAVVANVHRNAETAPFHASDFMPKEDDS